MTRSILLVEEHDLSRYAAAELLRESGYKVTEAPDEMEAIGLLHKHRFDLAIMGMLMPSPGSLGLLVWTRLEWPEMPIIVASHLSKAEIAEMLFGSVSFIAKPIDASDLLATITALIGSQPGTIHLH